MLINPVYEGHLFQKIAGGYGMNILMTLQALNGFLLYFGFIRINHTSPLENNEKTTKRRVGMTFISTLNFLFFTLPALWIVIFYPTALVLIQGEIH
jgi:hypothetical protein